MSVYGKCVQATQSKQGHTIGRFGSNTAQHCPQHEQNVIGRFTLKSMQLPGFDKSRRLMYAKWHFSQTA